MDLKPVPKIENIKDVREYVGAMGVHALEIAHERLTKDELSSTKLMLDFADLALKVADMHPKANSSLISAGSGAVINFHFSKPPPNHEEKVVTYDHEPPLPPAPPALQAVATLFNDDLM